MNDDWSNRIEDDADLIDPYNGRHRTSGRPAALRS